MAPPSQRFPNSGRHSSIEEKYGLDRNNTTGTTTVLSLTPAIGGLPPRSN